MNIEDIKKLRDKTGAGMMKAKEALEASGGDFDKANNTNDPGCANSIKRCSDLRRDRRSHGPRPRLCS